MTCVVDFMPFSGWFLLPLRLADTCFPGRTRLLAGFFPDNFCFAACTSFLGYPSQLFQPEGAPAQCDKAQSPVRRERMI